MYRLIYTDAQLLYKAHNTHWQKPTEGQHKKGWSIILQIVRGARALPLHVLFGTALWKEIMALLPGGLWLRTVVMDVPESEILWGLISVKFYLDRESTCSSLKLAVEKRNAQQITSNQSGTMSQPWKVRSPLGVKVRRPRQPGGTQEDQGAVPQIW